MDQYLLDIEKIRSKEICTGVRTKVVSGEQLMLSFVEISEGADMQMHSHPNEQVGVVLEGEIDIIIGTATRTLKPGDIYLLPPHVPHGVRSKGKARVLDVFCPPRKDYL